MAAAEEHDVAIIFDRRVDLDPENRFLAVGALDLLVRDGHEVGGLQHVGDRRDQVPIGVLDGSGIETCVALEFGVEVEVIIAQALELSEILVVKDRGEQPADLLEPVGLGLIGGLRGQRLQDVALAERDDVIPFARLDLGLVGHRIHGAGALSMRAAPRRCAQEQCLRPIAPPQAGCGRQLE